MEQLEEDPLRPLVIRGVRGRELVAPIHHEPCSFQLSAEVGDVPRNERRGMGADLERKVLGVDAEGIVPQGLEHRVPLEPLESSIDVIAREREEVSNVESLC